jgi:hypothetical protein
MILTAVSVAAIVYAVMSKDFCFSCLWEKIKNNITGFFSQFLTEEDFCDIPVGEE